MNDDDIYIRGKLASWTDLQILGIRIALMEGHTNARDFIRSYRAATGDVDHTPGAIRTMCNNVIKAAEAYHLPDPKPALSEALRVSMLEVIREYACRHPTARAKAHAAHEAQLALPLPRVETIESVTYGTNIKGDPLISHIPEGWLRVTEVGKLYKQGVNWATTQLAKYELKGRRAGLKNTRVVLYLESEVVKALGPRMLDDETAPIDKVTARFVNGVRVIQEVPQGWLLPTDVANKVGQHHSWCHKYRRQLKLAWLDVKYKGRDTAIYDEKTVQAAIDRGIKPMGLDRSALREEKIQEKIPEKAAQAPEPAGRRVTATPSEIAHAYELGIITIEQMVDRLKKIGEKA